MDTNTISVIIAVSDCFGRLAGWFSKRDDKIEGDSEWKGEVKTTLNQIKEFISDLPLVIERYTVVEQSLK